MNARNHLKTLGLVAIVAFGMWACGSAKKSNDDHGSNQIASGVAASNPTPEGRPPAGPTETVKPASNPPSLTYEERAHGCGHISVYKYDAAKTEGIFVEANRQNLGLGLEQKTFRIEDFVNDPQYSSLTVYILVSQVGGDDHALDYCTDIMYPTDQPPVRWTAVSGEVSVTLAPEGGSDDLPTGLNDPYRADVELKDVLFRDESGREIALPELKFDDAFVGWLAG